MMGKLTPASWFTISAPAQASGSKKSKPANSKKTPSLRRHPKPMREKLLKAIENLERWLKFDNRDVDWKTSLDDFRAARSGGVTNPSYVMTYEGDTRVLQAIYELDKAFEEMHSYRPEDYLTQDMVSVVASYNKTGKVNEERTKAKRLLVQLKYHEAPRGNEKTPGTQGWIRKRIVNDTSLSPRTVQTLAAELKKEMEAPEIAK